MVLKIASPGVPDFYQGTEFWDLNFVDPDNRRPVDFGLREKLLERIGDTPLEPLLGGWEDGRIKLLVTTRALHIEARAAGRFRGRRVPSAHHPDQRPRRCRRLRPDPRRRRRSLPLSQARARHFTADGTPFPLGGECWKTSRIMLPESLRTRTFRDVFTGSEVRPTATPDEGWIFVGQMFDRLPVALLRAL